MKNYPAQEYLKSIFIYKEGTGKLFWKRRLYLYGGWNTREEGKQAGSLGKNGYIQIVLDSTKYAAHTLIWIMKTGGPPINLIDHKNHDKSDNSWTNLREATSSLNLANSKPRAWRTLPKGVSIDRGRFRARISVNRKETILGYYSTAEEAKAAYNAAAIRYFGDFACL